MLSSDIPYSPAAVRRLLLKLGATPRYIGFDYVIYAITLSLENSQYLLSVTKELYPDVARKYHTTIYSVERDIRTVITIIWKRNPHLLSPDCRLSSHEKTGCGRIYRHYERVSFLSSGNERIRRTGIAFRFPDALRA